MQHKRKHSLKHFKYFIIALFIAVLFSLATYLSIIKTSKVLLKIDNKVITFDKAKRDLLPMMPDFIRQAPDINKDDIRNIVGQYILGLENRAIISHIAQESIGNKKIFTDEAVKKILLNVLPESVDTDEEYKSYLKSVNISEREFIKSVSDVMIYELMMEAVENPMNALLEKNQEMGTNTLIFEHFQPIIEFIDMPLKSIVDMQKKYDKPNEITEEDIQAFYENYHNMKENDFYDREIKETMMRNPFVTIYFYTMPTSYVEKFAHENYKDFLYHHEKIMQTMDFISLSSDNEELINKIKKRLKSIDKKDTLDYRLKITNILNEYDHREDVTYHKWSNKYQSINDKKIADTVLDMKEDTWQVTDTVLGSGIVYLIRKEPYSPSEQDTLRIKEEYYKSHIENILYKIIKNDLKDNNSNDKQETIRNTLKRLTGQDIQVYKMIYPDDIYNSKFDENIDDILDLTLQNDIQNYMKANKIDEEYLMSYQIFQRKESNINFLVIDHNSYQKKDVKKLPEIRDNIKDYLEYREFSEVGRKIAQDVLYSINGKINNINNPIEMNDIIQSKWQETFEEQNIPLPFIIREEQRSSNTNIPYDKLKQKDNKEGNMFPIYYVIRKGEDGKHLLSFVRIKDFLKNDNIQKKNDRNDLYIVRSIISQLYRNSYLKNYDITYGDIGAFVDDLSNTLGI